MLATTLFLVLLGGFVVLAAASDIRQHRIPNHLTVPAALLGVAFHAVFPYFLFGGWGALMSLAGLAVGFCVLLLPALLGGGGMGDVKLLAALGAWLGPMMLLAALATSIVAAALIAMITLTTHTASKGVRATQKKYLAVGQRLGVRRRGTSRILPFAVPVAVSTFCIMAYVVM